MKDEHNNERINKEPKKVLSIQSMTPETWDKIGAFLASHKLYNRNVSFFGRVAVENYIDLANKYGIDSDGKIKVPGGEKKNETN